MGIKLPQPVIDSPFSLEQSLALRRSVRNFSSDPLPLAGASQLLWAGQGITNSRGYRTAPSAGALYPLELYLVAGRVIDLPPGVYHYLSHPHELQATVQGDIRSELAAAALGQKSVSNAPAVLVMTAVYERTTGKYGQRGQRYVHLDAGHAAQNICLQATALGLATVPVGAFQDEMVAQILQIEPTELPLYILPVGKHKK